MDARKNMIFLFSVCADVINFGRISSKSVS